MKVAIIGYGKMGHEIEQVLLQRGHSVALQRGHSVALIIDQNNAHDLNAENLAGIDVAIEFTTPDTAYTNVRTCIECGTPVVSGTTGWHDRLEELQTLCKEKNSTMIWSSNYSLGVNITFRLNRYLAELMNRFDAYNVAIEEIHHTQKKDAPSGTAISLANDILARVERKDEWVNEPKFTSLFLLEHSQQSFELFNIHSEEEYRLMMEINKAFDNLSTSTADNNSAVYRINDSHSVIVADGNFTITNDTGDILGSISISNFARSPRAGFREIKRLLQ